MFCFVREIVPFDSKLYLRELVGNILWVRLHGLGSSDSSVRSAKESDLHVWLVNRVHAPLVSCFNFEHVGIATVLLTDCCDDLKEESRDRDAHGG